jgi:hypothetical protein
MSEEQEIAKLIKEKAKELNDLIPQANELDLNVRINQAMMVNKNGISLYATCKAVVYKDVNPIVY